MPYPPAESGGGKRYFGEGGATEERQGTERQRDRQQDMEHKRWERTKTQERDAQRRSSTKRYIPTGSKKRVEIEMDLGSRNKGEEHQLGDTVGRKRRKLEYELLGEDWGAGPKEPNTQPGEQRAEVQEPSNPIIPIPDKLQEGSSSAQVYPLGGTGGRGASNRSPHTV